MIKTKDDLKKTIEIERMLYLGDKAFGRFLMCSKNWLIWKWQMYLRYEEYYCNNQNSLLNKFLYFYYKRKKNILGTRLGFDVPVNCFEEGLEIHHVGPVTVNAGARIGKNCCIAGNICIGGKSGGVPVIGDNCTLGYGCTILGDVYLGENTVVGAGAVVLSSFEDNVVLAGIPAKNIKVRL